MTEIDRTKTDPFGNTFHIAPSKLYPGLFEVYCPERRSDWTKPKEIQGHFTGKDKAAFFLNSYLSKAWAFSDAEAEKNAKRAGTKKTQAEDATAA